MARVSAMSEDVVKKYRESKKDKLQRTFVSGSNAAENKGKIVHQNSIQHNHLLYFSKAEVRPWNIH